MDDKIEITDEFTKEQKIWLLAVSIGGAMRRGDIGQALEGCAHMQKLITKEDWDKSKEMVKHLKRPDAKAPDLNDPDNDPIQDSFPM